MELIAIAGLVVSLFSAGMGLFGSRKQNKRQQELIAQQLEDLKETNELNKEALKDARDQAQEGYEKAVADVNEEASTRMANLREDRDNIIDQAIGGTEQAGKNLFEVAIQNEIGVGGKEAEQGYSGVEASGTSVDVLKQTSDLAQMRLDRGSAALDMQRDQGFYAAYGRERGALDTEDALNRELGDLDLQLSNRMENLQNSEDLMTLNYNNQVATGQDQIQYLQDNMFQSGIQFGLDAVGAGLQFGQYAYEWDLFESTSQNAPSASQYGR